MTSALNPKYTISRTENRSSNNSIQENVLFYPNPVDQILNVKQMQGQEISTNIDISQSARSKNIRSNFRQRLPDIYNFLDARIISMQSYSGRELLQLKY